MATPKIPPELLVKNLRWTGGVTEQALNKACAKDALYCAHLKRYHDRLVPAVQPTPLQLAAEEVKIARGVYQRALKKKQKIQGTKRKKLKYIAENLRGRKRQIYRELLAKEVERVRLLARISNNGKINRL